MDTLGKYNRRRYQRFSINHGANYAVTRLGEDKEGEGIIKDASYGGLGLEVCDTLNKRAHIVIDIITADPKTTITVSGKVIWFKNYSDFASCGIKLEWVSNEEAYAQYVRRLEIANRIL